MSFMELLSEIRLSLSLSPFLSLSLPPFLSLSPTYTLPPS